MLYFKFVKMKYSKNSKLLSLSIAPLIINITLLMNFIISRNPVQETYYFSNRIESSQKGGHESTFITLSNNEYEKYYGIRIFVNFEQMRYSNRITYTFKEGLFGIRVMSDYEFIQTN